MLLNKEGLKYFFSKIKSLFYSKTEIDTKVSDIDSNISSLNSKYEEVLQSGVNAKENVVNAIISKKPSTTITTDSTWSTVANEVKTLPTAQGTATTSDVVKGKTFSNDSGTNLVGTLVDRSNSDGTAVECTPATTQKTLSAGVYRNGVKVLGDANLAPENIKYGSEIFGVRGLIDEERGYYSGYIDSKISNIKYRLGEEVASSEYSKGQYEMFKKSLFYTSDYCFVSVSASYQLEVRDRDYKLVKVINLGNIPTVGYFYPNTQYECINDIDDDLAIFGYSSSVNRFVLIDLYNDTVLWDKYFVDTNLYSNTCISYLKIDKKNDMIICYGYKTSKDTGVQNYFFSRIKASTGEVELTKETEKNIYGAPNLTIKNDKIFLFRKNTDSYTTESRSVLLCMDFDFNTIFEKVVSENRDYQAFLDVDRRNSFLQSDKMIGVTTKKFIEFDLEGNVIYEFTVPSSNYYFYSTRRQNSIGESEYIRAMLSGVTINAGTPVELPICVAYFNYKTKEQKTFYRYLTVTCPEEYTKLYIGNISWPDNERKLLVHEGKLYYEDGTYKYVKVYLPMS